MGVIFFQAPELANVALCAMSEGLAPRNAATTLAAYSQANYRCFAANYSAEIVAQYAPLGPATFDAILDAMIDQMPEGRSFKRAVATFGLLRYNLFGNEGEDYAHASLLASMLALGESMFARNTTLTPA